MWRAFRQRFGFPADRAEWAAANAGAYVGSALGGKAKPSDLVPQFRPSGAIHETTPADIEGVKAWFDSTGKGPVK